MRCEAMNRCAVAAVLLGLVSVGCAGQFDTRKQSWDEAWSSSRGTGGSGAPEAPAANAGAGSKAKAKKSKAPVAQEYIPPLDCERRARALRSSDRDAAWAALKACGASGHFTQLRAVVASWGDDLRDRPDAPFLLAQMVAARGGNVRMDVRVMRDAKIPVFTLRDCVTQPRLYEGRYVMIRGTLDEVRTMGDAVAARFSEHVLQAEEWEVPIGSVRRRLASTRYGGNVSGQTSLGNGSLGGSVDIRGDEYEVELGRRFDNVLVETGQEAVMRIATPDPFLENGRELVMLARFDGMRPSSVSGDEDDPELVPVLTLVGYEVPNALVMD